MVAADRCRFNRGTVGHPTRSARGLQDPQRGPPPLRCRGHPRAGGTAVICTEDEDLCERVGDIAGHDGVSKAIDCVSGQVGAEVSRALAPHGERVVCGALSTHRQTDSDKLTIPIFARSLIYETKTVRGFWLFRWFTETPKDRMAAAIGRTVQLADSGALRVPEGQPIPVEKFSEAVYLAEAPDHGGKPLLVFEP
ncbi:zinc-binding dehydrogenase [Mycobacterium sp.]|uniref:zinc-binding dehydrogenase n=1 Tax=Mycobacterium sp. TaxID=1785 RepID=UPI003F7F85E8